MNVILVKPVFIAFWEDFIYMQSILEPFMGRICISRNISYILSHYWPKEWFILQG